MRGLGINLEAEIIKRMEKNPEPEKLVEDCPEDWDEEGEHDD